MGSVRDEANWAIATTAKQTSTQYLKFPQQTSSPDRDTKTITKTPIHGSPEGDIVMKLSFLGQSYETSLPAIEATDTDETRTFLGKRYTAKKFNVTHRQPASAELIYRGVSYTR
jgi:hypothetical protein